MLFSPPLTLKGSWERLRPATGIERLYPCPTLSAPRFVSLGYYIQHFFVLVLHARLETWLPETSADCSFECACCGGVGIRRRAFGEKDRPTMQPQMMKPRPEAETFLSRANPLEGPFPLEIPLFVENMRPNLVWFLVLLPLCGLLLTRRSCSSCNLLNTWAGLGTGMPIAAPAHVQVPLQISQRFRYPLVARHTAPRASCILVDCRMLGGNL